MSRGNTYEVHKENFYDVIAGTGHPITALVIPKNTGLKGYAWKVLVEAGLPVDKAQEIGRNQLRIDDLTLLLRRGEDIPQIVVDESRMGNVVLGLTGDDLYDEFRLRNPQNPLRIENTYDWLDPQAKFLRPALCLINTSGNIDDLPLESRVAVNIKYEQTSRQFLETDSRLKGKKFEITLYSGDVESNVIGGKNHCCIDTVYTGRTLDEAQLEIAKIIRLSDLVVISPLKR